MPIADVVQNQQRRAAAARARKPNMVFAAARNPCLDVDGRQLDWTVLLTQLCLRLLDVDMQITIVPFHAQPGRWKQTWCDCRDSLFVVASTAAIYRFDAYTASLDRHVTQCPTC